VQKVLWDEAAKGDLIKKGAPPRALNYSAGNFVQHFTPNLYRLMCVGDNRN
jgi:hypothetical protein